MKAKYVLSL
jgi:potassium channel